MSEVGELNLGSEPNSNTSSSHQDLTPFPTSIEELEVIMIRTIPNVIGPILEPLIQRFVQEQFDLLQKQIVTSMNQPSGERPNSSSPRILMLRFVNKPSDPVLTGKPISGEDGTNLKIELVDENTDLIVKTGPHSSGMVEIAFLRVDTKSDEKEGNTSLNKCPSLKLNRGIGLVENISFRSRSKWTKKCKYNLIARFAENFDGISVMEAKSEVFTLEDSRNKRGEKRKLPTLADEVPCLDYIGKNGPYVKRLKNENIITVKNFLTEHFKNHQRLKEILKMAEKNLNKTIAHALTCKELEDKYIYYIPDSKPQKGIVLNVAGKLFGQISSCKLVPIETLSEEQKMEMARSLNLPLRTDEDQKSVVSALQHWGDVVPYNEHPLFSGHSDSIPCDHTPSITGHDYTPPRISSPDNILFGTSPVNCYDYNPSMTPPLNGTLSDIFFGTSLVNGGYDHTQPNTSNAKATLSDILVGTSQINGRSDVMQPSASLFSPDRSNDAFHVNCEFDDKQPVSAPEDITPLNDITPDHLLQGPNLSIDKFFDPVERLKKDRSKARSREWEKMKFVQESSHRKLGHAQKRLKFN